MPGFISAIEINAGSTTANLVGLYHYTTAAAQTKEAGSQVDVGFHYVAVGSGSLPIDTDRDGRLSQRGPKPRGAGRGRRSPWLRP